MRSGFHIFLIKKTQTSRYSSSVQLRRECCNEYYVLAARALATLTSEFAVEEDLWYLGWVGGKGPQLGVANGGYGATLGTPSEAWKMW